MTLTSKKHTAGRSKRAKAAKQLTPTELFFYEHAGYSYGQGETPEQGRIRCAKELAEAESRIQRLQAIDGWHYEWSDDWSVGSHKEFFGQGSAYEDREPDTCESCVLFNGSDSPVASLGCIDDADANYRRVIEAELADEALTEMDARTEALRASVQHMNE